MTGEPITHGGPDRRWKPCRCHTCRTVAVCSPDFDFFTDASDHFGPLHCQDCFMARHRIDRLITVPAEVMPAPTQPAALERN